MSNRAFRDRYGPVAVITGASSGIGEAFAETLAEQGLDLCLVARRSERLQALAERLQTTHHISAQTLTTDLGQDRDLQRLIEHCASMDIGLLINNAGYSIKGHFGTCDPGTMADMLRVNALAPMLLARAVVPALTTRGHGGLIFVASVEAQIGCPYSAAYSSSKALVKGLGEALWGELTPLGIDVLTVCPGATDTEALTRNGMDAATMPNVMSASAVANAALSHLGQGPLISPSDHYRQLFDQLNSMQRDQALSLMAANFPRD